MLIAQGANAESLTHLDSDILISSKGELVAERKSLSARTADYLKEFGTYFTTDRLTSVPKKVADYSYSKFEALEVGRLAVETTSWLSAGAQLRISLATHLDSGMQWMGDYIRPIHESQNKVWLIETGTRLKNSRQLINAGLVYRQMTQDSRQLGANLFIDKDMTRGHTRASLGIETIEQARRFSVNYYFPLNSWSESDEAFLQARPDKIKRYQFMERVVSQVDLSIEDKLTFYPNVVGKLTYSRSFGNSVDLSGKENEFLSSPQSFDMSLAWMPLPAVSFSAGQRFKKGTNDARLLIEFTFNLTQSIASQFKSGFDRGSNAQFARTKRYAFTNRNAEITLEYESRNKASVKTGVQPVTTSKVVVDSGSSVKVIGKVTEPVYPDYKQM